MKPSYEELESELIKTKTELTQTQELLKRALDEIGKLSNEISKLKQQLKINSKNSSKPPSTDMKGNTPDKSKKEREKRQGIARELFPLEKIDLHMICTQDNCPHCGSYFLQIDKQPEILQQVELPAVKAIITEYERKKYHCDTCGKNFSASLPAGIPNSVFGPRLMGLVATLTGVFHLAKRETIQLMKDLYAIDIAVGSIPNIEERVSLALDPVYQRIHQFVIDSKFCKYFDETGWRDQGKRHFVWLASCEYAAFYMIDPTRSSKALKRLIKKNPKNLSTVTDRYGVYNMLGKRHQYCFAHLVRDFRSYAERDGPDREIGEALVTELGKACGIHRDYRETIISLEQRNKRLLQCKQKIRYWFEDGIANGSDQLYKLCTSLLDNFNKLWTFIRIPDMEPTNNLAERYLRKLVIWRKKSYGTRSNRGKKFVERITSVAETVKRHSGNILQFIQDSIICFYKKLEAPLICKAMGF